MKGLFIHGRFYFVLLAVLALFFLGIFHPFFFAAALGALGVFVIIIIADAALLYSQKNAGFEASRQVADHLSNGDENAILISLKNLYASPVSVLVIDEQPPQFQSRNMEWKLSLNARETKTLRYMLRPVERGVYQFGAVHVYVQTHFSLLLRRFSFDQDKSVKVYPSYLQLKKYAFLAFDKRLKLPGLKRMRRLGQTTEFEQIKEYVGGDDTRTINWKASARTGRAMVNQFRDERAQPVYCVIDKGRLMQMPFAEMTLLDYAINTTLVMSYIAIRKEDNAGLLTFAEKTGDFVAAGRRNNQMYRISEALYHLETQFLEADFERLYVAVSRYLTHRSLLLLFTNFESLTGMHRQLEYLRRLNDKHVLVVIFFQNTELESVIAKPANTVRDIYHQTIAEKMQTEKESMVAVLRQNGIYAVLTTPQDLTVDTINHYLLLKARGVI